MEQCLSSLEWIDAYLQWATLPSATPIDAAPRDLTEQPDEVDARFATAYLAWMDARRAYVPERRAARIEPQPMDMLRDALLVATFAALGEANRSSRETAPRLDRDIDWPHTLESVAAQLRAHYGAAGAERAHI